MNEITGNTVYDAVAYPSYTHANSHIDGLATQAVLHGLKPAPIDASRVLELGCGDGSNLVPMAYGLPGSRFVGIDLSKCAVDRGRQMISDLGLSNVELRQGDLLEIHESWGIFDYIIVHGLFSWVPPEVREKILQICGTHLAPHGVAFISYLAYPGAHVRAMLRDMMLFRAGDAVAPEVIQGLAREVATLVASSAPVGDVVQRALQVEAARVLEAAPDFLFHDDLAEWNAPYYFVQFLHAAGQHGLQYLSEADPTEMQVLHLSPVVREQLNRLAPNRIQREQYLDFIKGRRFRQTLLCRTGIQVDETGGPGRLAGLRLASSSTGPGAPIDLTPGIEVSFHSLRGPRLDTGYAAGKAMLALLVESWPRRLPVEVVAAEVQAQLTAAGLPVTEDQDAFLRPVWEFVVQLHLGGILEIHMDPTRQDPQIAVKPYASPIARWQALRGSFVTSLRHVGMTYKDPWVIRLLPYLDGTRDREALIELLRSWEVSLSGPEAGSAGVAMLLEERLKNLADSGFLCAQSGSGYRAIGVDQPVRPPAEMGLDLPGGTDL